MTFNQMSQCWGRYTDGWEVGGDLHPAISSVKRALAATPCALRRGSLGCWVPSGTLWGGEQHPGGCKPLLWQGPLHPSPPPSLKHKCPKMNFSIRRSDSARCWRGRPRPKVLLLLRLPSRSTSKHNSDDSRSRNGKRWKEGSARESLTHSPQRSNQNESDRTAPTHCPILSLPPPLGAQAAQKCCRQGWPT